MPIYGPDTPGDGALALAADSVLLGEPIDIPVDQLIVRIGMYCDGHGPAVGSQTMRGALYTEAGGLVSVGNISVVADDQEVGLVWLTFDGSPGRILTAGRYRPALHLGPASDAARVYSNRVDGNAALVVGDTAPADGPYLWVQVDEDGEVVGVQLRTDGAADEDDSNALLFVQPLAPSVDVTHVALHPARDRVRGTVHVGDAPSEPGEASLRVQGTEPARSWPSARLTDLGGAVRLQTVAEPPVDALFAAGPPVSVSVDGVLEVPAVAETLASLVRIADDEDDDYYATLPFEVTQRVFRGGVIRGSQLATAAGWYGRSFDETNGAHAIVRSDGPLADRVGERLRVSRRLDGVLRSVFVYVHDEREFPDELDVEQILLSRRAFLTLGNHGLDNMTVTVETLS